MFGWDVRCISPSCLRAGERCAKLQRNAEGPLSGEGERLRHGATGHTDSAEEVRDVPLVERRAEARFRGR